MIDEPASHTLLRLRDVTVVRSLPASPITLPASPLTTPASRRDDAEPTDDFSTTATAGADRQRDEPPRAGEVVRILDRISLTIERGEHTVILGPNGSGKTSLLKLLIRQFYPSVDDGQTGAVEIWGQTRWHIDELRKRMGVVSGELDREFSLPRSGRMTALQAVLSGFDGVQLLSFTAQHDAARIGEAARALRLVSAAALAERPLLTLSTGERRRVLIARALVHRPAALVLDEPTTGLDVVAAAAFLKTLSALADAGITLILVTHHIEEILPEIRRAVLLRDGRIFADGPCEDLLDGAMLSQLFGGVLEVGRGADGRYRMWSVG
ncbi:MAG: ATP-binding cassette domain-containing protein [Planctomycetaceae bacterium]|nr:MAG: ATP-binding cassette domain-containing protein [Planctomycetaceae bacterium]